MIPYHAMLCVMLSSFLTLPYTNKQTSCRRRWWAIRSTAGCCASRGSWMVGIDIYSTTSHNTKAHRRKAQIPYCRTRNTCWHICWSNLSAGVEHRNATISTWGGQSAKGKSTFILTCFNKWFNPRIPINHKFHNKLLFDLFHFILKFNWRHWTIGHSINLPWQLQQMVNQSNI